MVHLYEKVSNTLLGLVVFGVFGVVIICMFALIDAADKFTAGLLRGIPSEVWIFFGLVLMLLFAHSTGKSLRDICVIRKDLQTMRQWEKRIQKEENAT